jgi:hypothetical protein
VHAFLLQTATLLHPGLPSFRTVCIPLRRSQSCVRQWPVRCWSMQFACAWNYPAVRLAITCCFLEILLCRCLAGAHTPHRGPLLLPHCTPVRPRVAPPREMNILRLHDACSSSPASFPRSVNTGGALAANKSARAVRGPPTPHCWTRASPHAQAGRRQPPFQRCLLCRTWARSWRWDARRRGSRGQRRVTYQRTRLIN